jgi:hypothetical protein
LFCANKLAELLQKRKRIDNVNMDFIFLPYYNMIPAAVIYIFLVALYRLTAAGKELLFN